MKLRKIDILGKLPDPFTFADGSPVRTAEDWPRRRQELTDLAVGLQYGGMPPKPEFVRVDVLNVGRLHVYRVTTGTEAHPFSFIMRVYLPQSADGKRMPVIVDGDNCWHKISDEALEAAAAHGYCYCFFDRTEVARDMQWRDFRKSPLTKDLRPAEGEDEMQWKWKIARNGPIFDCYPDSAFSVTSAWAWTYHRVTDALLQLDYVDAEHIVYTGLSRGGKTALLAGATDERAFLVNPCATCAGGGSCYRVHMEAEDRAGHVGRSETLDDIYGNFPAWFGQGMEQYRTCEEKLPFDSHELKALVAPRILFVCESVDDLWAGPVNSYLTTEAAAEVWKLLGKEENVYWYFRDGFHDQTMEDYGMLLNLMDHAIKGAHLSCRFGLLPFEKPASIRDWSAPEAK